VNGMANTLAYYNTTTATAFNGRNLRIFIIS
jgi:hypothetical protein